MRCIAARHRDRQHVLNQPFDVGLTPTVPTLPPRHNVLNLTVQEFQELNVMGLHEARGAGGVQPAVGPVLGAVAVLDQLRRTLRIPRY